MHGIDRISVCRIVLRGAEEFAQVGCGMGSEIS